jgi:hypothetical protein
MALASSEPSARTLGGEIRRRSIKAYCSELGLTEMMYMTCRGKGWTEAVQKRDDLLNSNLISVEPTSKLLTEAAQTKCGRALSLQDCFTIALARVLHCEAVFAKPESELSRAMKKKPFDIPISYLVS